MQTICGDARTPQAASEFAREQDVAQLRATVGFHSPEVLCRLKIIEIQSGALMRVGSRVDDARGSFRTAELGLRSRAEFRQLSFQPQGFLSAVSDGGASCCDKRRRK